MGATRNEIEQIEIMLCNTGMDSSPIMSIPSHMPVAIAELIGTPWFQI